APGAVVGAAGAVVQAVLALLVVALEPVVGALARDAHRLGGVGHRPPLLAYPTHQQQASLERQPGITVGHEDLRDLVVTLRQATPHPEVLLTSTNHRECHQRPGRVQLDPVTSTTASTVPGCATLNGKAANSTSRTTLLDMDTTLPEGWRPWRAPSPMAGGRPGKEDLAHAASSGLGRQDVLPFPAD